MRQPSFSSKKAETSGQVTIKDSSNSVNEKKLGRRIEVTFASNQKRISQENVYTRPESTRSLLIGHPTTNYMIRQFHMGLWVVPGKLGSMICKCHQFWVRENVCIEATLSISSRNAPTVETVTLIKLSST